MVNTLYIFMAAFGLVFFLGFQSLSVNSGHYWMAGVNSMIIGSFNLFLYKAVPHVAGVYEVAAYLIGGPMGIIAAMYVHKHVVTPWRERMSQAARFRAIAEIVESAGGKVG